MKTLYCEICYSKLAIIQEGSKLKVGMVCLCENCFSKYKISQFYDKTKPASKTPDIPDFFKDIFGGKI